MSIQSPTETQFEPNTGLSFTRSEMKLENCTKDLSEDQQNFIDNFMFDLGELCDLYQIERISVYQDGIVITDEEDKEFVITQVKQ